METDPSRASIPTMTEMIGGCPGDEVLEGLVREAAAPSETREHVDRCPDCSARLAELREDLDLFEELRGVACRPSGPPSIPGYRIESELSRGGQGVVYRAHQEATNRAVALKVLADGSAGSARERRRFEREVEFGSRLRHPGIVTVFDSGVAAGSPWYAMELVEGETLEAFVARVRPPLPERLRLFLALCDAVAHAHRAGVIHRDLKPSNVLIDTERRVRVLDFGTAFALGPLGLQGLRVTAPGEFLGTLAYAAPEQVGENPDGCDSRTDVYALGVMLYELLTGALPHDPGGNLTEVVARIAHAAPVPPKRRVPELDDDLSVIVLTALAKEREARYSSVEAMARDLRHHLAHEPIEARPRSLAYVLRMSLRRNRRRALVGALAFSVVTFLLGAFVRERLSAERARENTQLVRSVIQDLLSAAAPQRMGGDAHLRDVLQLASREIETGLEGAPDVQAEVQLTLGDTYRRLLMTSEAETHLRRALGRFRNVDGEGLATARCLDTLGQVLAEENRPEAVTLQEEALAIRRRLLEEDDPRIAESERGLAQALISQFRDVEGERAYGLLTSALQRFRAALGDEHTEVAATRVALARMERERDASQVEPLLSRALSAYEEQEARGERDPRMIDCLTEYCVYLQSQERFDQAEELLGRAERLTHELYGDELATGMLRRRANLCYARGELASAEDLTRRALVFEVRRWAMRRPEERGAIEAIARALEDSHPPEVEPPYTEAFRLLRRFEGDGSFELAGWMNGIVVVMRDQDRKLACEPLLREALNIRCRAWGADCPVRQRTLYLLAAGLKEQGRAAEAVPLLQESVAIAERQGEPDTAQEARDLLSCCTNPAGPISPP